MLLLFFAALALLGLTLATNLRPSDPQPKAPAGPSPFAIFVDDYFDAYFARKPSEGTAAGLHQYDDQLEDGSAAAVEKAHRDPQGAPGPAGQAPGRQAHRGRGHRRRGARRPDAAPSCSTWKSWRNWRKNPMNYISTPPGAIDGLMKRDFAPAATRLRSVIARLKATPAMFDALRAEHRQPAEGVHRPGHPHGRGLGRLLPRYGPRLGQRGRRQGRRPAQGVHDRQRRRRQVADRNRRRG